jgi:hypothetical protein
MAMALHEANALYRPGGMVNEIIVDSAAYFYIVDHRTINYSFVFMIYLHHFDRAPTQPLVRVALVLDWVRVSNCR